MMQRNLTITVTGILLAAVLLVGAFTYFDTTGTEVEQTARAQPSAARNGQVIIPDSLEDLSEEKKALIREHQKNGETPNRLIYASSPYLLQHAFNPVDWYPWGEEAFKKARRENKPIFLSVGYSTCYWCHVMERKVFSREDVARQMNDRFISIKVDREQQPDVDRIYMTALQMMTQSSGWPMSVFLTPELKPFFGATYIPPNEEARNGQGFQAVLSRIDQVWNQERQQVIAQADKLTQALRDNMAAASEPTSVGADVLAEATGQFENRYDPEHGGFGQAPKFPRPAVPQFLLRYYEQTDHRQALEMSLHTLREMARGGMYDHVGEGFHRYSTDARWRVPHFEKMLYDQALLTQTYLQAHRITGETFFGDVARDVLQFVDREMLHEDGGFYSALNAESPPDSSQLEEPEEGAYYVWTTDEISTLLKPATAELFNYIYGVENDGNALKDPHNVFVGKNILYRAHSIDQAAERFGTSVEEVEQTLARAEQQLLKARQQRIKPSLDDKIVLAWNGMMISAYARAYEAFGDTHFREVAVRSAEFLLDHLYNPETGRLQRIYRNGETMQEGTLEDYAYLAGALLDIYEVTGSERWLEQATRLTDRQIELFYDDKNGGFYDTTGEDETLLVRSKEFYGGARPAGNAAAVTTLSRLYKITGKERYKQLADETLRYFGQRLQEQPSAAPQMLKAFSYMLGE